MRRKILTAREDDTALMEDVASFLSSSAPFLLADPAVIAAFSVSSRQNFFISSIQPTYFNIK